MSRSRRRALVVGPSRAVRSVVALLVLLALQLGVTRNALGLTCGRNAAAVLTGHELAHPAGDVTFVAPLSDRPSPAPAAPVPVGSVQCSASMALLPASHSLDSPIERVLPAIREADRAGPGAALDPPFHPPRLT